MWVPRSLLQGGQQCRYRSWGSPLVLQQSLAGGQHRIGIARQRDGIHACTG